MIRTFVAIPAPVTLQHAVEEVHAACQRLPVRWRWVQPSHLHVTLQFLGDVPGESVASLAQALDQAVSEPQAFTLRACALGCFPQPSRPRVLWMGLNDPEQALSRLFQRLATALAERGFSPEAHSFRPHLTLARIRQVPRGDQFSALLRIYDTHCFGTFPVDALCLFRSQLRPEGAQYTLLHTAPLRPASLSGADRETTAHGQV
jgi:2'-5' RNA ligase